ncbi:MAG: hypothetical protein ACXVDA_14750, partial [Ktedonobacterales bacterium]
MAEGGERGKSGGHQRTAGQSTATLVPHACFLCAYSDHVCDVASVEGHVRDVQMRGPRGRQPAVLIETD